MRTLIWCEIVCATCAATTAGRYVPSAIPRTAMKNEAIKNGYWFLRGNAFCCRSCLDDYSLTQKPVSLASKGGEG